MYRVVKRDGKISEFDIHKISRAIEKAFISQNKATHPSVMDMLALKVTSDFESKIKDDLINVEDIQDSVEKVLSESGYADVAKAYILYRKQHEKVRNMKSTILDYKEIVDSYVNEKGERVYLFMIEYSLDENDPILEWEISAFKNDKGGHDVVGQIILERGCTIPKSELIEFLCRKYKLSAIKFYTEFELGEVTSKRDYILLAHDYEGYYMPCDKENLYFVNYSEDGTMTRQIVRKCEVDNT